MLEQILKIIFPAANDYGNLTPCAEQIPADLAYTHTGVFLYDENARRLVKAIKYEKNRELIPIIQKEFLRCAPAKKADFIIPVPLNPLRFAERGFNQAEEFVRSYAEFHGIPIRSDIVYRGTNTQKLAALSSGERAKATANIFQVWENKRDLLENKRILIVDDIITTGSTVKNLADVLSHYKPAGIEILGVFRPQSKQVQTG